MSDEKNILDKSLNDFINESEHILENVHMKYSAYSVDQLADTIVDIQSKIKIIQSIAKRMANISNSLNIIVLARSNELDHSINYIDPNPNDSDYVPLVLHSNETKNIEEQKINTKSVPTISDIPKSYIYYVEDIKQYAININSVIIKGNIGNICKYSAKNTTKCQYEKNCLSFKKNTKCKYYHESEEYIHHNKPVPDDNYRNFTPGSWIYSTNNSDKTKSMRHVGSRNKLDTDLIKLTEPRFNAELNNREPQLMHDLLIYMILCRKGMIRKYNMW